MTIQWIHGMRKRMATASLQRRISVLGGLLVAVALLGGAPATAQSLHCLPTCSSVDGRFLAVANGSTLVSLSGANLELQISVPAGTTSFQLGFFDGDARGVDLMGVSHWDNGFLSVFNYTLIADPIGDRSGTTVIELLPGMPFIPSTIMPDNDWIDFTVVTGPEAQSPSGNFFYRLQIELTAPSLTVANALKVRTSAMVSGTALFPTPSPFSYIANLAGAADSRIVYPSFPAMTPTTYDGTFQFFFDVPISQSNLAVWDGDFDRGKYDGTELDTDDPDTPNAPFRPSWSTVDAIPEGVPAGLGPSTGNPPDDRNPASTGIYIQKTPSVRYDLLFPDSQIFANENPSGNQEWERFTISTAPFDDTQMDYSTSLIPAGVYELTVQGVDMQNLNALVFPGRVLCVDSEGNSCQPIRPFLVGDTVFLDHDGDGDQDHGEPGLADVTLELVDELGFVLGTATTDADGHYTFPAEAETYEIRITASNFDAGGALEGYVSTTGDRRTDTVIDDNVLTYDFGYRGTASLGDRLWLDADGDGAQESGEAGLNGVTVELLDGSGNIVAMTTTSGDGNYSFDHLAPGTYTVRVVAATLPVANFTPTYDLDGTGTPNVAVVTLAGGIIRSDVDFGYLQPPAPGTGTLGYWKNHSEAWPVQQITIGGVTYTKSQAVSIMGTPGRGDKTYDVFKQLVAAKLNVLVGNEASCINATITAADTWMTTYPLGSNVRSSNAAWVIGGPLHQRLDDYNNGRFCAPHRD
ncbi:MAG TPA: SdrD B-like domain-containing protein [Thermoanaerobaculia bacterium]